MGRTAMKASTTSSDTAARARWCRATMSLSTVMSSDLTSPGSRQAGAAKSVQHSANTVRTQQRTPFVYIQQASKPLTTYAGLGVDSNASTVCFCALFPGLSAFHTKALAHALALFKDGGMGLFAFQDASEHCNVLPQRRDT